MSVRACGGRRLVDLSVGFTLIEVVVALAVLALVAVGLFGALRVGQATYQKVHHHGDAAWEVFAAQRVIRVLIESARSTQFSSALEGTTQQLTTTSAAPLALGGGELRNFALVFEAGNDRSGELVVRWRDISSGPLAPSRAGEESLLRGVESMEWGYLTNEEVEDGRWLDSWQNESLPPRLVRLRLKFRPGDVRRWPELIVAPRITAGAGCELDIVAQQCRQGS